jgi:hypothetical protein
VVSANLSINKDENAARVQAEECVRLLEGIDSDGFAAEMAAGSISPCGGAALAALLQSGLLTGARGKLVSGPLIKAKGVDDISVYYGGMAFE